MSTSIFEILDALRRAQGAMLDVLGLGPIENRYRIVASTRTWRLREYLDSGSRPVVLIVSAPFKRPYIWDLAPSASAVAYCLQQRLRVYLLEWTFTDDTDAGLEECVRDAIGESVAKILKSEPGTKPYIMGHSLGGTFSAMFAALEPRLVRGLVLMGAPLCFQAGASRFRDSVAQLTLATIPTPQILPGSLISHVAALASPDEFVWSRMVDAVLSVLDSQALETHTRVIRWTLDESPVPARLLREIHEQLYKADGFLRGTLTIGHRKIGPWRLPMPMLVLVKVDDTIAPLASVMPFIAAMHGRNVRILEHPGETGVGLQHLSILTGRRGYERTWPVIISWLKKH